MSSRAGDSGKTRPRLLVADDDAAMRQYMARLLAKHYDVQTAADGQEALAAARDHQPDLILSDVVMPQLDGIGLLRELRADAALKTVPVILLSALAGEASRIEGLQTGADDYVIKPFHSGELLARVATHIEMARVRKQSAEAIRESEERLRFALEASGIGAWEWDLSEHSIGGAPQYYQVFGYHSPPASWTRDTLREHLLPDDREAFDRHCEAALETRQSWASEYRIRRRDGKVRWLWMAGRVSCDDSGNPRRMMGVTQDVTDRKNVEEATLGAIPDLLFEFDREGRILNYHAQDDDQLYLPPHLLLGQRVDKVLPPDASDVILRALAEADEKDLHRGAVYGLDHPGGRRWFELSIAANRGYQGRERRFIVLARDITKRKRAEEQLKLSEAAYRTIIDSVDAMLVVQDPDTGAILDVNRKFMEVLGVDLEQAKRSGVREIASLDISKEEFQRICHAARDGGPQVVDASGRYKDGREFHARVHLQYVTLGGQPRLLASAYDVTELKDLTDAVAQARDAAEAANLAKSQFLANISHELRTPMAAILGMLEVSLRDRLRPAVRQHIQLARKAAELEMDLLNEILDFSGIEAGKLALAANVFELRTLLDQTFKVLAVKSHEKGLDLQYHLPRRTPVHLVGDPFRLQQILNNLVGNAIKFSETGEVVLWVAVESQTAEDVLLRFAVTDTGIGISREDQARIFRPFTQGNASLTRRYGGTGLGLSIASSLVALMGGQIGVDSEPGRGSTFTFTARFRRQPDEPEAPPWGQAFLPQLRDLRVLVAKPHAFGRQIVCEILGDWSLQPTAAASTGEAVDAAEQQAAAGRPFQALILDARMLAAEQDAWKKFLRRRGRRGPAVVVLVPSGDIQAAKSLRRFGRNMVFVEMPLSQADLLAALLRSLNILPQVKRGEIPGERLAPAARRLRILVADDASVGRLFVSETLQERGHIVGEAASGREALELVRDQPFDVVLMDLQMPEMDGYQATAAIRALSDRAKSQLPIVALTAHARAEDERKCLAAGMNAYLSKPIATDALIELLERLVKQAGQNREIEPLHTADPACHRNVPG